jgi:hypothetical protein
MTQTTCPHYTSHITGVTGVCRGCGATVVNPTSVSAAQQGLIVATAAVAKISEPAASTVNSPAERVKAR